MKTSRSYPANGEQHFLRKFLSRYFFLTLLALVFALFLACIFLLPRYAENRLFPQLGEKLAATVTGDVFSIGVHETSLGAVKVGGREKPALQIGAIKARYSPSSLINKQIDLIEINNLILYLEVTGQGFRIQGLDPEKIAGDGTGRNDFRETNTVTPPVRIDEFRIHSGLLHIALQEDYLLVPFELQLTADKQQTSGDEYPVYRYSIRMLPQGEEILVSGIADLAGNRVTTSITATDFDLQKFVAFINQQNRLRLGKAAVQGKATLSLNPFHLESVELEISLASLLINTVPAAFAPGSPDNDRQNPLDLRLKGNQQLIEIAARLPMTEPLSALVTLEGSIKTGGQGLEGAGTITAKVNDGTVKAGTESPLPTINGSPELKGGFSFAETGTGTWEAKIEGGPGDKPFEIVNGRRVTNTTFPAFRIAGSGTATGTEMDFSLQLKNMRVADPDAWEILIPVADFQGSMQTQTGTGQTAMIEGSVSLDASGTKIQRDDFTGMADVKLTGTIPLQPLGSMQSIHADGELVIEDAAVEDRQKGLAAKTINGRIPWRWPRGSGRLQTGGMKITGIKWQDNTLGSLETEIVLENSVYTWSGRFSHAIPGGLTTDINGKFSLEESGYHAETKLAMYRRPFNSLNLGRFEPSLAETYLSGELSLEGNFEVDISGPRGTVELGLENGRLEMTEKKYLVEDLSFSLLLPHLPELRTAPSQSVSFAKASIEELVFEDGRVIWQLESPESVFIEEGALRWAGGRIFTNAIRFSPNRQEFVVPIFCDRLLLSEILSQVGIKNAEGQGTVSGRIPLHLGKKSLRIEDGFLYSSPGQGGSIKLSALDLLSAGIPQNTPQFAQVDFAAEALKNFHYNWVRLLLNSEGEDLVMQMQTDGKPLQSLPFSYDSQKGYLQRIEEGQQGISQPIRLDVNFRFPLNKLLGYSGRIKEIWNKMQ